MEGLVGLSLRGQDDISLSTLVSLFHNVGPSMVGQKHMSFIVIRYIFNISCCPEVIISVLLKLNQGEAAHF